MMGVNNPSSTRRVFAVVAFLFAASCGGSSPTSSTPVPSLSSGAYVLNVSLGGGGAQLMVCGGNPTLNAGPLSTNVGLQHSGSTVTIQPDDSTATFRMNLQMSGATLAGTASGQFLSAGNVVGVGGQGDSPAVVAGTASSSGAAGNLTGNVSASGTTGTVGAGGIVITGAVTCNGGNWSITPR